MNYGKPNIFKTQQAYWINCCNCGLSHLYFFDVLGKNKIQLTVYLDGYKTQQNRQAMGGKQLDWIIKTLQAEKRRRKKLRATRCTDEAGK